MRNTVDDTYPASPKLYYITITPEILAVYKVMQDFCHQQYGEQFGTCNGSKIRRIWDPRSAPETHVAHFSYTWSQCSLGFVHKPICLVSLTYLAWDSTSLLITAISAPLNISGNYRRTLVGALI